MRFKQFYLNEGRNSNHLFSIKNNNSRWTFKNEETGKINYIKIENGASVANMQNFLKDIEAKSGKGLKTSGDIDFYDLAVDVVNSRKTKIYVNTKQFEKIKNTWIMN